MIISLEEYITEDQFWQGLGEIEPFLCLFPAFWSVFFGFRNSKKV